MTRKEEEEEEEERPSFDEAKAASLIGKRILIGLTYLDHEDNLLERRQLHGDIVVADAAKGFGIKLRGEQDGEMFWLPPDLRALQPARPGEYRLRGSGEV